MSPFVFEVKNRTGIIVYFKPPFLGWLNFHPDNPGQLTLEKLNANPPMYLIPYQHTEERLPAVLETIKPYLFNAILYGFFQDETTWPKERANDLFDQWFSISAASMLYDTAEDNIRKEKV